MAEADDLRGLNCPMPVPKANKRLRGLMLGDRLWMSTGDPLAVIDIPYYCRESGHALIGSQKVEYVHRFLIERGG